MKKAYYNHIFAFRNQISGYHQEDCPAVENDEPRTETGIFIPFKHYNSTVFFSIF